MRLLSRAHALAPSEGDAAFCLEALGLALRDVALAKLGWGTREAARDSADTEDNAALATASARLA